MAVSLSMNLANDERTTERGWIRRITEGYARVNARSCGMSDGC